MEPASSDGGEADREAVHDDGGGVEHTLANTKRYNLCVSWIHVLSYFTKEIIIMHTYKHLEMKFIHLYIQ